MTRLLENFLRKVVGLRVFALIGKSGTGKSFRARLIAERYHIHLIVDDGLLIRDGSIIAGRSAKNEKNYLSAIKTAVFDDPQHRLEVCEAIKNETGTRVLVLGTSLRMVRLILERLGLPDIDKVIKIEDVATEAEIHEAEKQRRRGRHVIPAPSLEVSRQHASIILGSFTVQGKSNFEKTMVRPFFHNTGRIALTETGLREMVLHCVDEFDADLSVVKLRLVSRRKLWRIELTLDAPYGRDLPQHLRSLQNFVKTHLERYTGLEISGIDVEIRRIM
jgi:adenylate kinase family enzyme